MFNKKKKLTSLLLASIMLMSSTVLASAENSVSSNSSEYTVLTKSLVTDEVTSEVCPPSAARSARPITPAYIPNNDQVQSMEHETETASLLGSRHYVDAGEYPFCAVGQLEMTYKNSSGTVGYIGTAFLEGPDVLFTAGHCAYDRSLGGWASSIDFYPARDGNYSPYHAQVIEMSIAQSYADEGKDDWAILRADRNLGFLGWFGKGTVSSALIGTTLRTSGYDGDKNGEQWETSGTVMRIGDNYNENNVIMDLSDIVCTGGHSGGPIFDNNYIVWSNLTFGGGAYAGGGRAIDNWIYDMLQKAYEESIARYPQ